MPQFRNALLLLSALVVACDPAPSDSGDTGAIASSGWCEVQAVFDRRCVSCHSPAGGTQGGLDLQTDAHAALVGASSAFPGRTLVVAGSPADSFLLAKLEGTQDAGEGGAMPPDRLLPQGKIDLVSQWIADGASDVCSDPVTTPAECDTTNEDCVPGTCGGEGPHMLPGSDCIACHRSGGAREAPTFGAAGTVFTDLAGSERASGVVVHIVDADGQTHDLTTNSSGNFYTRDAVPGPYTASLRVGGDEIAMTEHPDSGACSSCHRCDGEAGGKLYRP